LRIIFRHFRKITKSDY